MEEQTFALITFDVYSALFDVTGTLLQPVQQTLHLGMEEAYSFVQEWRRLQLEYTLIQSLLQKGHISFRTVTQRALDVTLHRYQKSLDETTKTFLLGLWDDLTPWPEARSTLQTLQEQGFRLALLSNGDRDMLEALAAKLDVSLAHVFSAQDAGVYKPHPAIYRLPVICLGVEPSRILHVAGSARDVMGAKAAGLVCAWRNAREDTVFDPAYRADAEAPDLVTLLQAIRPRVL